MAPHLIATRSPPSHKLNPLSPSFIPRPPPSLGSSTQSAELPPPPQKLSDRRFREHRNPAAPGLSTPEHPLQTDKEQGQVPNHHHHHHHRSTEKEKILHKHRAKKNRFKKTHPVNTVVATEYRGCDSTIHYDQSSEISAAMSGDSGCSTSYDHGYDDAEGAGLVGKGKIDDAYKERMDRWMNFGDDEFVPRWLR